MPIPPTSQTSILVIRRLPGEVPLKSQVALGANSAPMGYNVFRTPEPPFQITLDGIKIGTIHWYGFTIYQPSFPEEKRFERVIQPGHHNLSVGVIKFVARFYSGQDINPCTQPFEIALGETVTFLCEYALEEKKPMIRLEKQ
jgi:hypothetical protein